MEQLGAGERPKAETSRPLVGAADTCRPRSLLGVDPSQTQSGPLDVGNRVEAQHRTFGNQTLLANPHRPSIVGRESLHSVSIVDFVAVHQIAREVVEHAGDLVGFEIAEIDLHVG